MNNNIILFLLIATISSCGNTSSRETQEEKSQVEKNYEIADIFLQVDTEKIALLSLIKEIPQEQTNSVLRDYIAKTFNSYSYLTSEDPNYIIKVIDTIAAKNNISKKLAASIIFLVINTKWLRKRKS